jgi:CheY-like chemotaxis protein
MSPASSFCINNTRHSTFTAIVIVIVITVTLFEVMPQRSVWQTSVKGEEEEHVIAVLDFGVIQRQEKEEQKSSLTNTKTRGEEEEQEHDKESPSSHYMQHKHRNILLVDDESDICFLYQMVLNDSGYNCDSYTDSVKAIQEFRASYYDLILLDIKMPKLNGFELCKKIREQDKSVKIVFITASEAFYEDFRNKLYPDLYNIHYIQKPIGNDELVERVNATIKTQ